MRKFIPALLPMLFAWSLQAGPQWMTSYPDALQKAKEENKVLLAFFTGSDWCGWCKRLQAEVFTKPEFESFAAEKLVLLELDFPRRKAQSAELHEQNEKLASDHGVTGFPSVILFDKNGAKLGKTGYIEGGPVPYIQELSEIGHLDEIHAVAAKPSVADSKPATATYEPYVPRPPVHYDDLMLKGISGTPRRRMVLLNNETMLAGDSARIKLGDEQVRVVCKEIKDDSVIIEVENRLVELKLGETGGAAKVGKTVAPSVPPTAPKPGAE